MYSSKMGIEIIPVQSTPWRFKWNSVGVLINLANSRHSINIGFGGYSITLWLLFLWPNSRYRYNYGTLLNLLESAELTYSMFCFVLFWYRSKSEKSKEEDVSPYSVTYMLVNMDGTQRLQALSLFSCSLGYFPLSLLLFMPFFIFYMYHAFLLQVTFMSWEQ